MTIPTAPTGQTEASGRILVVDDDPSMRLSLEAILGLDFNVRTAQNVAEAEVALSGGEFDVVVTDYDMPGASGLDLVKIVNARLPGVMVILLTGHPDIATLQKSEAAHSIVRVLTKPYDAKRLISWVASTVKLARMSQQTTKMAKKYPSRPRLNIAGLEPKPYPFRIVVFDPDPAVRDSYTTQVTGFANANGYTGATLTFCSDAQRMVYELKEHLAHALIVELGALGAAAGDWIAQARATAGHSEVPILLVQGAAALGPPPSLPRVVSVRKGVPPADFIRALNALLRT